MTDERKPSRFRRWLVGGAWASSVLALLLGGVAFWLLATSQGAQFVLGRALALAGGSIGTVEGRLVGPLAVDSIEVVTPTLRLRAKQVALDWSPTRLLGGEVRIERLHAASLEIATLASKEPAREPATLVPPVRLHVGRAGVDRLLVGTLAEDGKGTELRDVSFRLAASHAAWILGEAGASTPFGRAKLAGTVGAAAPFPIELKGELLGTRGDRAYRAMLAAAGTLAKIDASLDAREGGLSGNANARIEPFSAVPLRSLAAKLAGLDLSAFAAVPGTDLAVEADLAPRDGALLAGPVKIANAGAGPFDKGRLPVASATAYLAINADRFEATKVAAAFAGGGSASGEVRWAGGKLDATLVVKDADLRSWHSRLRETKFAGSVAAVATSDAQAFDVALVDPRFEIRGEARIAQGVLTVNRARLSRGAAFAEASGTLALGGAREFRAQGLIERIDPAAFARVPAGELNATFTATGTLANGPAGEVVLEIAKSHFADMAVGGRVALATDGARLSRTDADVTVGANRLVAKGSLGRAGDTLDVKLVSPDLAPLGRAFGHAIGGSVDLEAKVSGAFVALSGHASIEAKNLVLPGAIRVAAASGRVELGAGDAGAAHGQVAVQGVAQRGDTKAWIDRATVAIKGTRRSHEIRLAAEFPDRVVAQALLDGGVLPGTRLPEWRGRLESLSTTGLTDFALSAPATLVVSAERIELGEAVFGGEPGEVRLAVTRWTPAGFETRGTSSAVVVRTIRQLLKIQGEVGSTLVLAGQWDVRVGDSVDGFVSIRRERGDVRVGEPRQALGLEALSLRMDATGGRVKATVDIRGRQAGQWKGEVSATLARAGEGWEISPTAPLDGRFTVDVPDLAWTAGWLGPEARAGGRLAGEGTLAGTRRDPTWSGRIEATKLAIRDPALGAEVADGTIVIALKDREARIERFALSMPWVPSAEAARAIASAKHPVAGTVTAEGGIDLGTRKGSLRVKADAWPLTRLASRFLAVSGEGGVDFDGPRTAMTGRFAVDAGWFGIPDTAAPSLSDDVIIERGETAPVAARDAERIRLDLRVDLGEHLYFVGRGLNTRLAGSLRLVGDVGANLRTTGTIRAVGGTYEAYGRKLALERGALNFQGPIDNPGLNVLALRKGLPVEAGVEIAGTVARPKVRLVSVPDVPESEKLAWLVLGRGRGDVSAADAAMLVGAASSILGRGAMSESRVFRGLGIDELSVGAEESGLLGTMPQSTVAGRTGGTSAAEVVTVGKQLTDNILVSYKQGLADAEGSFRVTMQFTKSLQFIVRAGYLPGIDVVYRFNLN
ncbi:MAG: translocation/assembly module TamB domain-containing protein [Betaproteobacteria bacterium]|nr:translocation/assembly module TamB domain-containing protein [Betaproteobacteria bacterium]